ncbi:MAG TPA: DNA polymerase IV [Kineosporiaceae bacterium]|nr:DNA polymerase IV [Kineosporiaceae bacterium]
MRTRPVILHLDLDAFFSAVEQLHKPSLRGKPVVVGGTGRRGVVSTASYEARVFGVGSAMSIGEARRRCPNAAYLAPRFVAYRDASRVVMGLLAELSPLIEQVSVDEAYVDLTPTHPDVDVVGVTALAEQLRVRVTEVTGLTASIGVSTSKLLSKIGSELNKPNGVTVIPPGAEVETLAPMPIRKLPGVGPATQERLYRHGLRTIGEVAAVPLADLIDILGQAHGQSVHQHARGVDDRVLEPDREAKSVSAETTFPFDLTDQRELVDHARRLTDRVIARLAKDGVSGRTITLKIRSYDFSTITRSVTLDHPTDSAAKILGGAKQLLGAIDTSNGIRLLGVGVSGLSDYAQQDLLVGLGGEPELDPAELDPDRADLDQGEAAAAPVAAAPVIAPVWTPGQDVLHAQRGAGWVQGAGLGRVTVRFEGPHTGPGPIATYAITDPALTPAEPPVW